VVASDAAARTVLASDAEGFRGRARGGYDRRWTASVAKSTDTSVERSAKMASRPRLTVARWRLSVTTDASDAVGANTMVSNDRTCGGRRSYRRYCASSVGSATDATVQRLSPPKISQ
jgi:hypothetical protein